MVSVLTKTQQIKIHIVCSPLTEIRQRPIELNTLSVISHSCHSWVEELWAVFNGACVCVFVCVCVCVCVCVYMNEHMDVFFKFFAVNVF